MGVPLYKDHSQHVPVHAHMLHTLSRQVHHIGISMRCRFGANGNVTLRPHTSQHGPSRPRGASVAQPHPRAHHALAVHWCARRTAAQWNECEAHRMVWRRMHFTRRRSAATVGPPTYAQPSLRRLI